MTGVQTCALPIWGHRHEAAVFEAGQLLFDPFQHGGDLLPQLHIHSGQFLGALGGAGNGGEVEEKVFALFPHEGSHELILPGEGELPFIEPSADQFPVVVPDPRDPEKQGLGHGFRRPY